MKLEFRVLIIDDEAASAQGALNALRDYLAESGFSLSTFVATDLSAAGIRALARQPGKNYDLVIIDYKLGSDINGTDAAESMRRVMRYTDIVYFSSQLDEARREMLKKGVDGVFITHRRELERTLIGVAETVICKAVDLTHMRGIAMAEVAEMDVLLERTLVDVYSMAPELIVGSTDTLLEKISSNADDFRQRLDDLVGSRSVVEIVSSSRFFSSLNKYEAVRVLGKKLPNPPRDQITKLSRYQDDIIENRNILAHAREEVDDEGNLSLKSARRGSSPVSIDEAWFRQFRVKLRDNRRWLGEVCAAISAYAAQTQADRSAVNGQTSQA